MKVSEGLRIGRAGITKPGTWIQGRLWDRFEAFCAVGTLNANCYDVWREARKALYDVLVKRYFSGRGLPTPVTGCGLENPISWEKLFGAKDFKLADGKSSIHWAVTQFNNSTSHAEVLALFDEAITDQEAKERSIVTAAQEVEYAGA